MALYSAAGSHRRSQRTGQAAGGSGPGPGHAARRAGLLSRGCSAAVCPSVAIGTGRVRTLQAQGVSISEGRRPSVPATTRGRLGRREDPCAALTDWHLQPGHPE
eukprot:763195-Hanusia_phi.AAC.3